MVFFKWWLAAFVPTILVALIMRFVSMGQQPALAFRVPMNLIVGELMLLMSWLFYKYRLETLLADVSLVFRRVIIAVALIIALCAHLAFLFYYMPLFEDSWFVYFCFLCFAVYIHTMFISLIFFIIFFVINMVLRCASAPLIKARALQTAIPIAIALLLTAHGATVAFSEPKIVDVDVRLERLGPQLDGFNVALLTDLHVGPTVSHERVAQIVRLTNALNADIIAIAGDVVDGFVEPLKHKLEPLRDLRSRYGTLFSTGNHEYYWSPINETLAHLRTLNMSVLHNSNVLVRNGTSAICFAGVDDLQADSMAMEGHKMDADLATKSCPKDAAIVLLVHQPNGAAKILKTLSRKIDLLLAGHTHHAQLYIFLPFAYWQNAYFSGLYTEQNTSAQIYVSSGVNYWGPPVKIHNTCEIINIHLRSP